MLNALQISSGSRHGVSVEMTGFHSLPANCQTLKIYPQAGGAGQTHSRFHNYLL
ncbi:hypothetical protein QUB70_18575 [Microcoleus sp. A003_D6]|uniref:hypothetical protein n=1 Tax=Microcoleus sp. A003_D6 TaxID=3055266 RepID=UPI002FD61E41